MKELPLEIGNTYRIDGGIKEFVRVIGSEYYFDEPSDVTRVYNLDLPSHRYYLVRAELSSVQEYIDFRKDKEAYLSRVIKILSR